MDAVSSADVQVVLEWVDHFYATSWSHLLVCLGVMGAIVGVVVPLWIQYHQNRTMRLEREEIRAAIVGQVTEEMRVGLEKESALLAEKIAAETRSLEEKLARDRAELEEKSRKMEGALRRGIARASGNVFGVQANMLVEQKSYESAAESILDAIGYMIEADDRVNLRRQLVSLTQTCLPTMTKAQCEEMDTGAAEAFDKMMTQISKWDTKNDFKDAVSEARRAYKAAMERSSEKKNVG